MFENKYTFTNDWFEQSRLVWDELLPRLRPKRILEVGSFEGRSTCYLIEKSAKYGPIEVHCVDTWTGGREHQDGNINSTDMKEVEIRFHENTKVAISAVPYPVELVVHKCESAIALSELIAGNMAEYFDFIYIDGSHEASDVITDAVLSFKLLKVHGVMIFDDYLWTGDEKEQDLLRTPKIAIDAFTTLFARKLQLIQAPVTQIYAAKISR